MSLLRLLAAGRSLIGWKETTRYREADPASMPKFVSKKHPFGSSRQSQSSVTAQPALPEGAATPGSPADPSPATTAAAKPARASLWNWFSRWRRPQRMPTPRLGLVQVELCLDRVKVLRNDLSDSDLEIVPARAPVTKKARPEPVPSATPEPRERAAGTLG